MVAVLRFGCLPSCSVLTHYLSVHAAGNRPVVGLLPQLILLCCASESPLQTQAFLLCKSTRTTQKARPRWSGSAKFGS
ncbi:hypothetical protein GBJ32_03650 [Bifidobacterium longum]|uniref:Uncharacterized protein n=1 Tax=Bifidobacterium longum TaxID=216816 RepID=A0A374SC08_BIFLN|nr:hypothetical protein GBL36_07020 [Bifidobacterium longum]MBD3900538.1 hypothetical protein [Bifidobacterium longum subsp. longum]MBM5830090.1 hypothetical protein [Bifidobacterium longum subsp. suillum]MSB99264.1 hypothetical protein [Lacticaseibacillus rhamnosus]KAB6721221.1 hypothetical protein GBL29_07240 [Bifidobacterium longum]